MASQSPADQGTASIDDIERYEVIGGVRLEREPMGAFETMLAPWLWHLLNSSCRGQKLGLALEPLEPLGDHGTDERGRCRRWRSHLFSARARVSPGAGRDEHLSHGVEARVEGP